jgi:ribosomal protein L24E
MDGENGRHHLYVVPLGFELHCFFCGKALYSGTTFYVINQRDVCRECEGKTEQKKHRRQPRTSAEWMAYEVG